MCGCCHDDAQDPQELFGFVKRASRVLAESLYADALYACIGLCIEGMLDTEQTSANGATVVLHALLKERGAECYSIVPDIIKCLKSAIYKMDPVKQQHQTQGVLHATRTVALHHREVVVEELLKSTMPFSDKVVQMVQSLSKNKTLLGDVLGQLMEIVNTTPTVIERADKDKKKEPIVCNNNN